MNVYYNSIGSSVYIIRISGCNWTPEQVLKLFKNIEINNKYELHEQCPMYGSRFISLDIYAKYHGSDKKMESFVIHGPGSFEHETSIMNKAAENARIIKEHTNCPLVINKIKEFSNNFIKALGPTGHIERPVNIVNLENKVKSFFNDIDQLENVDPKCIDESIRRLYIDPISDILNVIKKRNYTDVIKNELAQIIIRNDLQELIVYIMGPTGLNEPLNDLGTTALMFASYLKNERIVEILITNGANVETVDIHGFTYIDYSTEGPRIFGSVKGH
jgi:hypothetical protein